MGSSEIIKSVVKPPFANYDIVVYFGCGLFVLPFLRHYITEPFGLRFPVFTFEIGIPFISGLITALSLFFAVYILGHIIAYAASQLIEKTVEMIFAGKTSSVITFASKATSETRAGIFRDRLGVGFRHSWTKHSWLAALVRFGSHLPVFPIYIVIYFCGIFGFYSTRVPHTIITESDIRLSKLDLGVRISDYESWFKIIEGVVINNQPIPTARMYNYLVIAGLFRSVALIFLFALWMEVIHFLLRNVFALTHIGFFLSDSGGATRWLVGYAVLSIVYLFSLFSFLKFQRRYVEVAIFAFVLSAGP